MSSRIIISPHCDDEVIGCYTVLLQKVKAVIFLHWNDTRKLEAEAVARKLKFRAIFDYEFWRYIDKDDTLFIPCILDSHPDHKEANLKAKQTGCRLVAYTVDKNIPCRKLPSAVRDEKRKVLEIYKSQQKYDEINELYIKYEGFKPIKGNSTDKG